MRKLIKNILPVFIFAFLFSLVTVMAGNISTLNVTESSGKIQVSGTTDDDVLAVAITVYNSKDNSLVAMQTTSVGSNKSYSDSIAVTDGTYTVKVADYNGGEYLTKNITIGEPENEETTPSGDEKNREKSTETSESENAGNPRTEDNIFAALMLAIFSSLGLVGIYAYSVASKKKNSHI